MVNDEIVMEELNGISSRAHEHSVSLPPTTFRRLSVFITKKGDISCIKSHSYTTKCITLISLVNATVLLGNILYGQWNSNEKGFSLSLVYNCLSLVFCIHGFISVYFVSKVQKRFDNFVTGWTKVWDEDPSLPIECNIMSNMEKCSITAIVYTLLGPSVLATVFILGRYDVVFNWKGLDQQCFLYFHMLKPAEFFIFFFAAIPNYYCQVVFSVLCMVCVLEFNAFQNRFKSAAQTYTSDSADSLGRFRNYHFRLIKLVHHVDETLSYYTASIFFINLPCICLLLYAVLVHADVMLRDQMTIGTLGGFIALHLMVICFFPSMISFKAQNCLAILEDICSRTDENDMTCAAMQQTAVMLCCAVPQIQGVLEQSATTETLITPEIIYEDFELDTNIEQFDMQRQQLPTKHQISSDSLFTPEGSKWLTSKVYEQLILFLQQVNCAIIGISCGGFFIITKEVLLTLGSILITYFFLIMQLHQSADKTCKCQCPN